MASLKVEMTEFIDKLALTDSDYSEILESAAPIAEDAVKKALRQSVRSGSSELIDSVKPYKPKRGRRSGGYSQLIGPTGTNKKNPDGSRRKKPVRNAEIAAYLNYGTKKMSARPWLDKAANNAKRECAEKMQEEFNRRTKG